MVNETLSLNAAHHVCSEFEQELTEQAPFLSRIITHIEGIPIIHQTPKGLTTCESVSPEEFEKVKLEVEKILRRHDKVKGYHALEFWAAVERCILEVHAFFDGSLNISQVHVYTSELEQQITDLKIENLQEIIIHAEPVEDQHEGVLF